MAKKLTPNFKGKQVNNRLTRTERIEQIKVHIREIGLWNLPTYETLGIKYGVSKVQIHNDIHKIISQFDPHELDEVFTEFFEAGKKQMRELRKILHQGSDEEKMRASDGIERLKKGTTELLEAWSKKSKVVERIQHEIKAAIINIHPAIPDKEYEIVPQKSTKYKYDEKGKKIEEKKKVERIRL